jgi:hypothetical protein
MWSGTWTWNRRVDVAADVALLLLLLLMMMMIG